MSFRIIKKPKGYIVEKKITQWSIFGLKEKWIPYVKSSGLDCAWHHSTYAFAMMSLLDEVKKETYKYEKELVLHSNRRYGCFDFLSLERYRKAK